MPAITDGRKPDDQAEGDGLFAEIELAPAGAFASFTWSVAAMLAVAWPGSGGRGLALILTGVAALILVASSLGGSFPAVGRLVDRGAPWLAGLGVLVALGVTLG